MSDQQQPTTEHQSHPLMRWFDCGDASGKLLGVNVAYQHLAQHLDRNLKGSAEKTVALRKLLDSKEAAVRAVAESGD